MNIATISIGAAVIGLGVYFLIKAVACSSRGDCTSCTSCPFAQKCGEEAQKKKKIENYGE